MKSEIYGLPLTHLLKRFHWGVTLLLLALAIIEAVLLLNVWLNYNFYRTGRPQGIEITLAKSLPVYPQNSSSAAFLLPAGTVVQSSTPDGLSTLGKRYGFEYLLIIHSKTELEGSHTTNETNQWVEKYSFSESDLGW